MAIISSDSISETEPNDELDQDKVNDELLAEAKARFALADQYWSENLRAATEDDRFISGDQWSDSIKSERDRDRRPCLVINKLSQAVNQVTNDQRQNRPAIKVHPVDDGADIGTAKVLQGMIRNIEYSSNADTAYDTAFKSAADGGLGYWRVITAYVNTSSFDQEVLVKRIRDRNTVRLDPNHQEPDGSDAEWGFILDRTSKDDFKRKYPKSKLGSSDTSSWAMHTSDASEWVMTDSVLIAEYFYKVYEEKTIHMLSNGQTVFEEELENTLQSHAELGEQVDSTNSRVVSVPKIKWAKLNGVEVLEQTDWPGIYIPIVPVYGAENVVEGKVTYKGIVRDAKDPARMYNYMASAEAEAIGLAPKAPFVAAEGQIEGYEKDWQSANTRNHAVLKYKPTSIGGVPVPPPQRNSFEPAVQAISQSRMLASDDLKATTGIFDAALGNKSNETSGIAIQRRNNQAQTSNYHLIDNLTRAIRHTGKIIVDLIPKIYDTPRIDRIIGEDGEQKVVKLNQEFEDNGKQAKYMLNAGKYDVTVDTGPSFQTKRQEAVSSMLEMTRSVPQMMQVAGDLLIKAMDWPNASEIAERIKKTLPPGVIDDPKNAPPQIPPQVQAQMQQMNQMVEQLTNKVHELQDEKDQKLIELESKERIEMKKLDVQVALKMAEIDQKDSLALLNSEMASIKHRLGLLDVSEPFDQEPQDFAPQPANGGMPADQQQESQPTGGFPPGQPMEGNSNVDPNQY